MLGADGELYTYMKANSIKNNDSVIRSSPGTEKP